MVSLLQNTKKDSEDQIPLHGLTVVDQAKIRTKTKFKVPLSRGKKRILAILIFALIVWSFRVTYHRWNHFHYVQVAEKHVTHYAEVAEKHVTQYAEATHKQVAGTWSDLKKQYYYKMPADFDCQFDADTCQAALEAHPQWQAEAKEAIQHIWSGYCQHSFGHDNVDVVTGKPRNSWVGAGIFVMDSLTTLWLAGMKKEFYDGVKFIETIDWGKVHNQTTSFFEVVIRALGGLLGAYDLSGEKILLQKAQELADRLLPAFKPNNPFPNNNINLITGNSNSPFGRNRHYLAELGTFQLEFRSLSYHTGDPKYQKYADEAMLTMMRMPGALRGLFINLKKERNINATDPVDRLAIASDSSSTLTIGGGTDSYYEYLLKLYIQSGFTEPHYLQKFKETYNEGVAKLQHTSKASGLTYWGEYTGTKLTHMWEHLSCFMGGSLVLGHYLLNKTQAEWKKTGTQMGQMCRAMYEASPLGLAPERVFIDPDTTNTTKEVGPAYGDHKKGILRPEAVETWFYLHYYTGDPKYRQWAHEYLTAMNKHSRTEYGYSEITNVFVNPGHKDGRCESFVMAETVKYLYLMMSDRETLNLNDFVFNTEAHPLKIIKNGIQPVL